MIKYLLPGWKERDALAEVTMSTTNPAICKQAIPSVCKLCFDQRRSQKAAILYYQMFNQIVL